ncbi:MAG: hypothetical protein Q8M39_08410 [Sulfuricurvum sp.]|nr:hypothetical protein [Sulfuricurvum sp.]
MDSKNLEAIAYGTDPDNDICSMFGHWAMEQKASDYPNIEDAYIQFGSISAQSKNEQTWNIAI